MELARLQAALDGRADPKTRAWWERYLKGAIAFRGVKMAGIRACVRDWWDASRPLEARLDAAFALLALPLAEDKLAGILALQEHLADALDAARDLPRLAAAFDAGHVADWNTCDWLCVRVLGPLAARDGEPTARAIAAWKTAPGLWRRRASVVAFVDLAGEGDARFDGFTDLLLDGCAALVQDPERFAQTGVGWLLRSLSDVEPARVAGFAEQHRDALSREALRMATSRLPDADRDRLLGKRLVRRRR